MHKVANTVGRVMTTGINMANKSSSALQSHDQPELDARYVYVGVHADGPTRVLCFSETRDEYTRGTSEESVALLKEKLRALEERNKVRSAPRSADSSSHFGHLQLELREAYIACRKSICSCGRSMRSRTSIWRW